MQFKLTIHRTGIGMCALTGKESDGLSVTFGDGTIQDTFLSWKAFRQLLNLKTAQASQTNGKQSASANAEDD